MVDTEGGQSVWALAVLDLASDLEPVARQLGHEFVAAERVLG